MEEARSAPGEALNLAGEATTPRQAATVIVLRGGADALEVLLVRRNPQVRFMGGAWVFPGGAVDAADGTDDSAHRACAIREAEEEAGIRLPDPEALIRFSRWITPAQVQVRFDTHFFLAAAPPGQEAVPDGAETVDVRWIAPQAALDAGERGELLLVFPTIKHLERLAHFDSAQKLLAWAHGREVVPVLPRIVLDAGERARVLLPGEPGYAT